MCMCMYYIVRIIRTKIRLQRTYTYYRYSDARCHRWMAEQKNANKQEDIMSKELQNYFCGVLEEAAKIAQKTKTPVDDFIVYMLQRIFHCDT